MAKEIQATSPTGLTLYALVLNSAGQVWNGSAFVTLANSISTYALLMAESLLLTQYTADFPSAITTLGEYNVQVRKKLTGSYLTTDPIVAQGSIKWTGSAVEGPQSGDSYPFANRTVCRGTVGASSPQTTSFTPSALSPACAAADQFKGRILIFDNATTTTALRGQATDITGNTADALPIISFTELTNAPVSGDTFSVV